MPSHRYNSILPSILSYTFVLLFLIWADVAYATRTIEKTETYDVHEYKYVGMFESQGKKSALVQGPDGNVYRVRAGNYIGRDYGEIEEVTENLIRIKETLVRCDQPGKHGSVLNLLPRNGLSLDSEFINMRNKKISKTYTKEANSWQKCLLN